MANMINSKAPLSGLAKLMAMKGRDGDTMLAHINPMEAKMLSAMGGRGTPNPSTGLPEYAEDDGDSDDSGGGENSGSSGEDTGSNSSDSGGFGDSGGSNQDWVDAYNQQYNSPSPQAPNNAPKTTAQIVDDWYSNPYNATGITSVEQMRGRDAYNSNPFDAYDPSGPDAFGSGNFKGLGGLGTLTADLAQNLTAMVPGIGTLGSIGIGKLRGQNTQDAIGRSLPYGIGSLYSLTEKGKTKEERDASTENSFSAIGDRFSDKYDQVTDILGGVGRSMTDAWGTLIDTGTDAYTGSTGIGPIDRGDSAKDDNAYMGDGSALFGGTAFTPEQNESAFGDSEGSTERKRQMKYIQQRAQAPDATPEEVLRLKQVSNPDYIYTPGAMRTYAERGGPSHFKMVQANTGGGLSDLYNMNEGGTFSGMVKGPDGGDGMSDDVAFDIKDDGQGGPDKALLSKDEYVIDAHSMSLLGNGSSDAGADQMDKFIKDLRKSGFGTTKQPKQLDGAEELSKLL
tara:strand:- start:2267 stop:3793 length:1527 start_codon:yes stop_codon:yes gene_type:complete